jgi:hypothetical protein
MPSIEDVANQINAKLDAINNATSATAVNTADTLAVVHDIRGELVAGFANLSQGVFALLEQQRLTNRLLDHNRRQSDTIICELVNGNNLLCGITRQLTVQVETSEATLVAVRRLEGMAERELTRAAGDYDRALELKAQIEACCPPPRPEPVPCPPDCDRSDYKEKRPEGKDWRPLDRPEPVG